MAPFPVITVAKSVCCIFPLQLSCDLFTTDEFVLDLRVEQLVYEWMNENARILSAFENRLRAGFV